MPLVVRGGKLVLAGGKLATDPSCCCGIACPLPDGDCPHALCIEFKLDADDTSDHRLFALFGFGATFSGIAFYHDPGDNTWNLYGFSDIFLSLPAVDAYDTWHRLVVQITDNGDGTVHVQWSVDDVVGDPGDETWDPCALASELDVGAVFSSGDAHRTIRITNLIGNPDSVPAEGDFNFPPGSWATLNGGAVIDGDGNLRIDNVAGNECYATHFTGLKIICEGCKCPRDIDEINSIVITVSGTATRDPDEGCEEGCEGGCEGWTHTLSNTWTLTRIPHDQAFDTRPDPKLGPYQFKLWVQETDLGGGCCAVNQASNIPSLGSMTKSELCPGGPGDGEGVFVNVPGDAWGLSFLYDPSCEDLGDSTTVGGTARILCLGQFFAQNCDGAGGGSICGNLGCDHTIGDLTFPYSWTLDNFSSLIGTISESNDCVFPTGTAHVDVTIAIT